jgi:hypothetical protein
MDSDARKTDAPQTLPEFHVRSNSVGVPQELSLSTSQDSRMSTPQDSRISTPGCDDLPVTFAPTVVLPEPKKKSGKKRSRVHDGGSFNVAMVTEELTATAADLEAGGL